MLLRLPNEVEELIYDFLISPLDVVKISCLSKYMKNKVDNVAFVKEKRKLHNRCRMFVEDSSFYYQECKKINTLNRKVLSLKSERRATPNPEEKDVIEFRIDNLLGKINTIKKTLSRRRTARKKKTQKRRRKKKK